MTRVFGFFIALFLASTAFANTETAVQEQEELMDQVELNLDTAVRCRYVGLPGLGSPAAKQLGREIRIWSDKRKFRKKYLTPLIDKSKTYNEGADAAVKISVVMDLFREDTIAELGQGTCKSQTEIFILSVEKYIEAVTAK